MKAPNYTESDFAMQVLSERDLIDPVGRLKKLQLVESMIPIITTNHLVSERSEALVAERGFMSTQCPTLFLDVPARYWDGSEEEVLGMQALSDAIWAETGISGSVQAHLTGRHILCRAKIKRNVTNPTGSPSPMTVPVSFVTDDADVANVYYTTPITGSLVRKAESVTKQLDLGIDRMPENADVVATLLSPAVQEAVNKLSQVTARAGLQLTVTTEGQLALTKSSPKKAS
jgi:hypothetical protein